MTRIDLLTNPMTTAEDIIVGGVSGAPARLAKGSDDDVLTVVAGAVAWQAPSGASLGAWTTYTPTWTAASVNPTLGDGTLLGRYKALDSKTYAISIQLTIGSTTNIGSGVYEFALPGGVTSVARIQALAAYLLDNGTRYYVAVGRVDTSATTVSVKHTESTGTGSVAHNAPFTFAANDQIVITGIIEVV